MGPRSRPHLAARPEPRPPRLEVAYQGERGAFSEAAALAMFPGGVKLRPCRTFEDVFRLLEGGSVTYGLLPIENSLGGSIDRVYELLLGSDLLISGEMGLPVVQCLMARAGATIKALRRVYSHPQALAQCARYLNQHPGWELHAIHDTAGAARQVAHDDRPDEAAIASRRAAVIYGLTVLAEGIQDASHNITRFVRVGRSGAGPTGKDRTSIVFGTSDTPGALYKSLSIFAIRDVNLKKLESRPSKERPWDYVFYLDFEGHVQEERVARCLDHLKEISRFVKFLGSYPVAT